MSQIQYALDLNDRPTVEMLNSLGFPSRQDSQSLKTQVQYLVTDVGVTEYHDIDNPDSLGNLPKYAIVLHRRMESFESMPGQMVQLVDRQGKSVRERFDNGTLGDSQADATSMYVLNAVEAKAAIDSGIYDNQKAFEANLKHNLVGQSYLVPDQVAVNTQTYTLSEPTMQLVTSNQQTTNPVIKLSSAQPVTSTFVFNSKEAESNFGAVLYTKLQQMGAVNQQALAQRHAEEIQRGQAGANPSVDHEVVQTSIADELLDHAKQVTLADTINSADEKRTQAELHATINAMNNDKATEIANVVSNGVTGKEVDPNDHPEIVDINNLAVDDIAEQEVTGPASDSEPVEQASPEEKLSSADFDFSGLASLVDDSDDKSNKKFDELASEVSETDNSEDEGAEQGQKGGAVIDTNSTADLSQDKAPTSTDDLMAKINALASLPVQKTSESNYSDEQEQKKQQKIRNARTQEQQDEIEYKIKEAQKAQESGGWTFEDGTTPGMSGDESKMLRQLKKSKGRHISNNKTQQTIKRQQRIEDLTELEKPKEQETSKKKTKSKSDALDFG